ncbi:acyltransferase [Vibrio vulnificus]|nr:acyltransferase [Vibrio vulnificus]MCU8176258.1 acyltransferase [Vibrio vulnificus]HAS8432505.1 acyltransferase [Vibrio vulnificus]
MLSHKLGLVYTWMVWLITFILPDMPVIMRLRGWLYSLIMKEAGRNFQVSSGARLYSIENLSVGDDVYVATNVVINAGGDIRLNSEVMIGIASVLISGNHTIEQGSYRYGKSSRKAIEVGFGSWIGANCTLVAGAIVPPSTLIGANSVVTKPLKQRGTYGGTPAKLIKES